MRRGTIVVWTCVVVASVGVHAVAFGGLGGRRDGFARKPQKRPTTVEMSVAKAPEPPPPPPPPPAAAKPAPRRVAMARPAAPKAAPPPSAPPPPAAAPPAEESPADFTGVTMTNDGPGGEGAWATATGNGQAMNGPVGRPGGHVNRRVVDGDPSAARRAGPPVVGLGDLSAPPTAPDLTDALAAAYPAEARSKGVTGKAVVRARVMPDGAVRELALASESAPGFGDACLKTLRDSRWSPPLDRQAHPVSTFINYTCRFNVQ